MVDLAASALTTLDAVLDELGLVSDGGAQDNRLKRYCNGASDFIANACSRVLHFEAAITEHLPAFGDTNLLVKRPPIVDVTSISIQGTALDPTSYAVRDDQAGIIFRATSWPWSAGRTRSITWPQVPGSEDAVVQVVYDGGWVTPAQATQMLPRTLPYDLEDACITMVVARWSRQGSDPRVKSESLLSYSASYIEGDDGGLLPPVVRDVINRYARVVHV